MRSHFSRRALARRVSLCIAQFLFLVLSVLIAPAAAQAQDIDWVLNLDDTGTDPIPAGGTIVYTATVTNNGVDPAPATTLSITVPANTTLTGASGSITGCAPVPQAAGGTVVCNVPPLNFTESASVVLDVLTTASGTETLSASVPTAGDVNPANNALSENTTVTAGADIAVTVSGPPTAASGSNATYTFTAENLGPDTLTSASFQFPIPTGLVNITPPAGCSLSGSTYTCAISGPLAVGASVDLPFTGQISAASGSTLTPVGSVLSGTPPDPVTTNNTASINTVITGGSDVSISKTRNPAGSLLVGDAVSFTLAAAYTGDSPTGLTITDTIPANYAITSVTPSAGSGWSCTVTGQDISCTRTSGSGPGANISLGSVTVDATVVSSGTPVNTASITSTGPIDPNPANNSDTDGGATISDPVVDLRANKSGPTPPLVVVGNSYNFNISTTNVGNADFFGTIIMTDSLPAGLTVTGYTQNGWTCSPATPVAGAATITCQRVYTSGAPLAAGATTPNVVLQTTATGTGTLTNGLSVASPDANIADPNPANDTTSYSVTSSIGADAADISVNKTAALATVAAGDVQTFTIEVVNAGPQPSTSVTLTDNLTNLINNGVGATGAGLVSVSETAGVAAGLSCSTASSGGRSRLLTCSVATLPVCTAGVDCPVITVAIRPGGNGGTRTNTAQAISSDVADPNLANNTGSASYTVDARADVTVTKVDSPDPAVAGQNLTYVITARNTNNGLSAAANVTVTDTLPADVTFISATPAAGSCSVTPVAGTTTGPGNDTVTCNLGTINNGAQRTVTVVVQPNFATRGTTLSNTAVVTTTTTETDTTNNSATETTQVQNPALDLLINKDDVSDPIAVNDNEVYTIRVQNLGPSAAENLVITDSLPAAGLSFVSNTVPSGSGGACPTVPAVGSFGGTLICTLPRLAAGATTTFTVTVEGEAKGTFVNDATVSSDEVAAGFDTDPLNNTADEPTTVRTRADVEVVSKTAVPDPVNLREDFNFVVIVRNNTGPGLAEADNVTVTDTLPSGMELTGTPSVIAGGTTTSSTCTGSAGATSFSCDLGTFASGGIAQIAVPVQIVSVSALPQVFTNTASISTSSLDVNPSNNTNSGTVTVNSSSIAGVVFLDFADDGSLTAGDTGVGGVTLTLTGTAFDGAPITATTTTNPDGTYSFDFLPQGDYTITRGTSGLAFVSDGTTSAGSVGGTVSSATVISSIALPSNTAATDYDYPLIPQARIGLAKDAGSVAIQPDGSFIVPFSLTVENFSLEALDSIVVTDPLQGAAPLFGTLATPATPATDPLSAGTYAITAAPSGSCGGLNAGFNGAGDQTLASGFNLASNSICTIAFTIRVQPTVPVPPVLASGGRYENQATVTGEGVLSGQTSATNAQLTDLSDDGANADADGDGQGNEAGENDPTPVAPVYSPSIALVKTADTTALSSPPVAGETVTYNFEITNTGNVTLTNVTLTDSLAGLSLTGGPIASLAPGATDTVTYEGTYNTLQTDIDTGSVTNQAEVVGTDPFGTPVSDLSGTTTSDDIPLVTPLSDAPSIALVKTAFPAFSSPPAVGDPIVYAFTVTNTGNVTLTNVTVTDPLPGIVVSGGPIPSLAPGASDSTTFSASYALTQGDIDAGEVPNQATATGTPPSGPNVSDLSGADAVTDNITLVPVAQAPGIDLVKTVDASDFFDGPDAGDELRYGFTVTNTGSVTLTNVTISDPLPGLVLSGGPIASLAPGASDSATFTATYIPTPADIAAGSVSNTATVTGAYGPGGTLSVADTASATANVIGIDAVPEVFAAFPGDGGTTTTMLASDIAGGGPATLYSGGPPGPTDVTLVVISTSHPGVSLDPATSLITLAPGNPAGEYTVTYEICSVLVPTVCDQAVETVTQSALPGIEVTKLQALSDNGDGIDGVGDTLVYTILVENTGNTPLENITLTDTFTSLAGNALALDSGPDFVSASAGSPEGELQIGETATHNATFIIIESVANDGGTSNTITAEALPVFGPGVPGSPVLILDISDDGDDLDGNTLDDPTVFEIVPLLEPSRLSIEKTTPRGIVERGSVVPYTITVRNEYPTPVGPLDIVDALPEGFLYAPGSATLDGVAYPVTVSGRIVFWEGVVIPPNGEVVAELTARVTQGASAGEHVNRASLRDPLDGAALLPVATATVRILPEAVFDCGDVVGKVFDDRNGDGYQNDPGPPPIVSDDAIFGGKLGKAAPASLPETFGEPGIPGVRLAGVDGTIITTDEFGRFHVPCAMLPDALGSNFILKIDTRSLPAGYRLTTENPRVVRLTAGKMTEMNFGATLTKVVRIDLNERAFVAGENGRAALSPPLVSGIAQLLPRIAGEPVTLRLAYHLPNSAGADEVRRARALMELVEDHIRAEWRDVGRVKLTIERTLARSGE